ncbi:hypothetical protein C0J52_13723 [Blattella germanica]|nr:hypothetical protein C0J52_13723 [Blattella germanica]
MTILLRIKNFRTEATAQKKKPPGDERIIRTPENIESSANHSAEKHAIALGISDQRVQRILQLDLKFHPYKMMLAQEISHRHWEDLCRKQARNIDRYACPNERQGTFSCMWLYQQTKFLIQSEIVF